MSTNLNLNLAGGGQAAKLQPHFRRVQQEEFLDLQVNYLGRDSGKHETRARARNYRLIDAAKTV
jgi:hypothetical protein